MPISASTRSVTVWDEIERLAPAYRGITRSVLDAPGAADGVVAPLSASPSRSAGGARSVRSTPSPSPEWSRWSARAHRPGPGWPNRPTAGLGDEGRPPAGADDDAPGPATGVGRTHRARRAPRGSERRVLAAPGGVAVPLRPGCRGGVGPGPGRPGGHGPAAGQPARPRRPRGGRRVARSVCGRQRPPCDRVADASLPRKVVAADFNVPLPRAPSPTSSTPPRRWSSSGWRRHEPLLSVRTPCWPQVTRSTSTAWGGWCSSSSSSRCWWCSAP